MQAPPNSSQGLCYKFTVGSADQAAAIIRDRLGPRARVLSVKTVEASGFRRLWAAPKLEVVARVDPEENANELHVIPPPSGEVPVERFPRTSETAQLSLQSLLRRSGVSDIAIGRLQIDPAWPDLMALPLHRALVEVSLLLKRQSSDRTVHRPLGRAAFLSTASSGRTSSLCKWLGIEVFRNQRRGQVYVIEFDRPNPIGPLPMFCEALGVPFGRLPVSDRPSDSLGFVYFDMPGISVSDSAQNAPIAEFLDREKIEQRVLVLNLAYDQSTLRAAYAAGRALGATHLVFTHMDEIQQWGRAWDYLCDGALEPLFLATGPALTGDCNEDVWGAVVRRTLASAGSEADVCDEIGCELNNEPSPVPGGARA